MDLEPPGPYGLTGIDLPTYAEPRRTLVQGQNQSPFLSRGPDAAHVAVCMLANKKLPPFSWHPAASVAAKGRPSAAKPAKPALLQQTHATQLPAS